MKTNALVLGILGAIGIHRQRGCVLADSCVGSCSPEDAKTRDDEGSGSSSSTTEELDGSKIRLRNPAVQSEGALMRPAGDFAAYVERRKAARARRAEEERERQTFGTPASAVATAAAECNASLEDKGAAAGEAGGRRQAEAAVSGRSSGEEPGEKTGEQTEERIGEREWGAGRLGWRVGEGMTLPSGGIHAMWNRAREILAGKGESERGGSLTSDGEAARKRLLASGGAEHEGELRERREAVVRAVRWAWEGYTRHAWGTDELRPLTRDGTASLGLGVTIVDSMDTLWLAGEREAFARCVEWVTDVMDVSVDKDVNVFETTIRVVGGLLGAFHLSGEEMLLERAEELGRRLAKAFDTPSGIPYSDVNLKTGHAFCPAEAQRSSLAEATTLQLEFSYLTEVTGDPYFHEAAQRASEAVDGARVRLGWSFKDRGRKQGLAPVFLDPMKGLFGESGGSVGGGAGLVTFGARGDSYYEYLLKQWLYSGKKNTKYLQRYQEAIRGVEASLIRESYPGGLWYIGERDGDLFSPKMDHLVCFLPGTLALGHLEGAAGAALDGHLTLARRLMDTCYQMYARTATGLASEIVHFLRMAEGADVGESMVIKPRDRHNNLRPEALESLYYLYWITKEEAYRDKAWAIFEAFEEHCRVDQGGYAGLEDVTDVQSKRINKMETYFVSESLKYLLMIFSEENPLPFDRYVFNTEAHAFPIL